MCGIVGYIGEKQAPPVLLEALKKLEYRGYDSSGIGVITSDKGHMLLQKTRGKIKDLQALLEAHPFPESSIGICHTRWATHGVPNKVNAHPHADCTGKILVVHNGIIENFEELKKDLRRKGHKFASDTDTEVVAHLIEENYRGDLVAAVRKAIKRLRGAFALGVMSVDHPDALVAARVGSPLIIGLGKNENFIASDAPAILEHTRRIIYLKDGQMAVLRKDKVDVSTFGGKAVKPKIDQVTFKLDAVRKQGYAHFMLKEIHEQPEALRQMLQKRLKADTVYLEGLGLSDRQLKAVRNIVVVACGTAYHAGLVGKYVIERLAGVPVSVDVSSEFRYRQPIIGKNTLVMAISQSGETADTLAAVREAKAKGAKVVSICNVLGSSLARESDGVLYTYAGPEIGVASTKAYTAQLCMLYLFALKLSGLHRRISAGQRRLLTRHLREVPSLYEKIFRHKNAIAAIAKANSHFGCFLFLGRNINYPSALEGALKLKEISYIPAEGYAAGEMKHGPIALIDEYRAVVCLAPQSPIYEKMVSNMQEIRARRGNIIAIATEGDKAIARHAHQTIYVPRTHDLLTPLLVAVPLQLLAYYIAVKLGCDVDQPRNLAKSVTVE
ncbi:MAG: glutamine--fructose-6-phosphate transaminase (isomerizing) [Candidatus Omnitrophica bacterium]|nr:glutamine--fructose-6-phosphate transaminase (isomerizing) [Candidatus Omnitrophota bacterium]